MRFDVISLISHHASSTIINQHYQPHHHHHHQKPYLGGAAAPLNQAGHLVGLLMPLCVGHAFCSLCTSRGIGLPAWIMYLAAGPMASGQHTPNQCMRVGGPSFALGPLMTATAPTWCAQGSGRMGAGGGHYHL